METWLSLVSLPLVLLTILLYFLLKPSKVPRPPSPLALPIIGHLHLLGNLPHQSLSRLSKRYGPLFSVRLGAVNCLVASSQDMAREFLKTHDASFASRPKLAFARLVMYDCRDMVWAEYGPRWRELKRLCTQELFSHGRLEASKDIRQDEISCTIEAIIEEGHGNRAINVRAKLFNLAINVVTRMAMGKKYFGKENSEEAECFRQVIEEAIFLGAVFNVGDFVPFLARFDLQGYEKRMKAVHKDLDSFFEGIVQEHKLKKGLKGLDEKSDLMDVLLAGDHSHETIKAFVTDLIGAGTDTNTVSTEWALAELLKSPSIMQKAQKEIDEVVGFSRRVEEEDLPDLKYLQAIVKETLRLHPAGPLLIPHESIEECNVGGYQIPKGTTIFVNVWAIGRDPSIWDEPEKFNPDRFRGSSVDVKGRDMELIPFGSGRRMCPGYSLALCMMQLTLARLLQRFDWSVAEGHGPDLSEKLRGTLTLAQPLQAIAKSRTTYSSS